MAAGAAPELDWATRARRWTAGLLLVGVAWRLIRYGLGFPVWGDEAALLIGLVQRHGYADLLRPLGYNQVAPLGFLAVQYTVVHHLGTSEHALRLFPLLTGTAALILFARLAWLAVPPLAAMCAIGVFAAAHYITRYSLDIKPYGTDLMVASALLLLAVTWRRAPTERRWLVLLFAVAPIALVLSYPAVFVVGAIAVWAVSELARRRAGGAEWTLVGLLGAVSLAVFVASWYLWAHGQYVQTKDIMLAYWARGLPPADLRRFVVWVLDVHTAEMMAYPLGGKNGASALTLILCALGVRDWWRRPRARGLLLLLGLMFVLTFLAAVGRQYPYGGSARVAQHLAPPICLWMGTGIQALVERRATVAGQRRAAALAGVLLLVVGLGGTVRDVVHPYHTRGNREVRTALTIWRATAGAKSGTWVPAGLDPLPWTVQWYVLRGVHFDRAALYEDAAVPATLVEHPEWWLLGLQARGEAGALADARTQLTAGGFARTQTLRVTAPRFDWGAFGEVVELERWERLRAGTMWPTGPNGREARIAGAPERRAARDAASASRAQAPDGGGI